MLSSLILHNSKPFLDGIVMHDEKWILYSNQRWPARWMDREEALKHFPKPNLHQKNIMVIVAALIHYSLLNPGETITSEKFAQQIDEMHWELQHLQPALVNRKGPILSDNTWLQITQPTLRKRNEWATKFCLTWLLANWLPLKASQQLYVSTTRRRQKMLSKSSLNPEACIFML